MYYNYNSKLLYSIKVLSNIFRNLIFLNFSKLLFSLDYNFMQYVEEHVIYIIRL